MGEESSLVRLKQRQQTPVNTMTARGRERMPTAARRTYRRAGAQKMRARAAAGISSRGDGTSREARQRERPTSSGRPSSQRAYRRPTDTIAHYGTFYHGRFSFLDYSRRRPRFREQKMTIAHDTTYHSQLIGPPSLPTTKRHAHRRGRRLRYTMGRPAATANSTLYKIGRLGTRTAAYLIHMRPLLARVHASTRSPALRHRAGHRGNFFASL